MSSWGDAPAGTDASGGDIAAELEYALGTAWDEALEPFRSGGEGAEVTWLRQDVG